MKKKKIVVFIALLATVGFGGVFAYNVYDYYRYMQEARAAKDNAQMMQNVFSDQVAFLDEWLFAAANTETDMPQSALPISTPASVASPLDEAREMTGNQDIIAYLMVGGTNIADVVVQGHDNNYYLRQDIFGNQNNNGSFFMDFRNSPDFSDPNSVIFGHNMRNGAMFHELGLFMEQDFFEANRRITILTDTHFMIYEIFAAFSTSIDFDYIQIDFASDEEFSWLIEELLKRSHFDGGANVNSDDKILILSTCTNTDRDMRYVIASRLVIVNELER